MMEDEGQDLSDYVTSESDSDADPYRDDPQWNDLCANACDVVGAIGNIFLFVLFNFFQDIFYQSITLRMLTMKFCCFVVDSSSDDDSNDEVEERLVLPEACICQHCK
jgi:hypothetical protein